MRQLSIETKEAIVQQALNRDSKTLEQIARENNIGYSTLQKWIKRVQAGESLERCNTRSSRMEQPSRKERFNHLLATYGLDEVSLGKYCREHGLYSHQLTTWQESFMSSPDKNTNHTQQSELKKLRDANKQLQKELRRKEKALAEASALLIMKKKADLIWGEDEAD